MRGNAPTLDSALLLLQNLLVENEELVAIGQLIVNKYIEEYNFVDKEYEMQNQKIEKLMRLVASLYTMPARVPKSHSGCAASAMIVNNYILIGNV